MWLAAALILVAVICVGCVIGIGLYGDRCRSNLLGAANGLALPPESTSAGEKWTSNPGSLSCGTLERSYASTLAERATTLAVVATLKKAGYHCVVPFGRLSGVDWCGPTDEASTYWQRTDSLNIYFTVSSDVPTSRPAGVPINPAWQSFMTLYFTAGSA
jgi:hypothetical protein